MKGHQQTLAQALRHQQAGQVAQAEALCLEVVRQAPHTADAWALLSILAFQNGNALKALEYCERAIAVAPRVAAYRGNRGVILQGLGRHEEALAEFREVLRLAPNQADAHFNLANALRELGRKEEAAACYRRAVQIKPGYVEALNNLGALLTGEGKAGEAVPLLQRAVQLQQTYAEAHLNLGNALGALRRFGECTAAYEKALELRPDHAETHSNQSNALRELGRLPEAEAAARRALELESESAEAHLNLGNVHRDRGEFAAAEQCYHRAVELKPDLPEAHNNLGTVLWDLGRFPEVGACYRRAIELRPDYAEAHHSLAMVMLADGDLERGWSEYEWRWRVKENTAPPYGQPPWEGEPLAGRTILLQAEQGLGDTLQFIRYAQLVKARGGRVLFACPPELVWVLQSCMGIDQIVLQGTAIPAFDVHAPLMSLPRILKTTCTTIPASIPYLTADAGLQERWREELSKYREFKIGIVWQGNPRTAVAGCRVADRKRSFSLAEFEPVARVPGVRLFSLQKGFGTEQLAEHQAAWGIVDLSERLTDFADTAAAMKNLDLVISADTSPVHLAGALGVPTWAVLPVASCWRWLLEREDSPWYPTMRLFRQRGVGDWGEVFGRMAQELTRLAPRH